MHWYVPSQEDAPKLSISHITGVTGRQIAEVNLLEMLSGGYYKSAIHCVVQPPRDQRGHNRLGVFYYCYADDDVKLEPLSASPVLQRAGIKRHLEEGKASSAEAWRKGFLSAYGTSELKKSSEEGVEEEEIHGIHVKH